MDSPEPQVDVQQPDRSEESRESDKHTHYSNGTLFPCWEMCLKPR